MRTRPSFYHDTRDAGAMAASIAAGSDLYKQEGGQALLARNRDLEPLYDPQATPVRAGDPEQAKLIAERIPLVLHCYAPVESNEYKNVVKLCRTILDPNADLEEEGDRSGAMMGDSFYSSRAKNRPMSRDEWLKRDAQLRAELEDVKAKVKAGKMDPEYYYQLKNEWRREKEQFEGSARRGTNEAEAEAFRKALEAAR